MENLEVRRRQTDGFQFSYIDWEVIRINESNLNVVKVMYTGTLSDCLAYIELKSRGYIRE